MIDFLGIFAPGRVDFVRDRKAYWRGIEERNRQVLDDKISGAKLAETVDKAVLREIAKHNRATGGPMTATEIEMSWEDPSPFEKPRGTFSRPVVADPVLNHTELAHKITEARAFERMTGVKTPLAIEQIIQSWELDR